MWQRRRPENTAPDAFYTLAFHRDGTGYYATNVENSAFSWTFSGSEVSFVIPTRQLRVVLRNTVFTSDSQFTTLVFANDEPGDARLCILAITQPTNTGSLDELLVNETNFATRTSTWDCLLNELRISLVYLNFGTMYFIPPNALHEYEWLITPAGDIEHQTFNETRNHQFFIESPVFTAPSSRTSPRVYTDTEELGTLSCARILSRR